MKKIPPGAYYYDAFLNHASGDKEAVQEIAERFRNRGLRVWLDSDLIIPGDSVPSKIAEGLELSRSMVVFLSEDAERSDWVRLERSVHLFDQPVSGKRKIIPVLLEQVAVPTLLRHLQHVDASNGMTRKILDNLVKALL